MKWSEFLAELRHEIGDTGATPRFSDKLLWSYTRDALTDISRYPALARRFDGVLLAVDTQNNRKYALPSDFISEITVECPEGTCLEPRRPQLGRTFKPGVRLFSYYVDGAFMYLNAPAGVSPVKISYYGLHLFPTSETDVDFVFTVPSRDMELLRLYVTGRVFAWIRQQQSKLDRFKVSGGARDDNPLFPETMTNERTYEIALAERLPAGAVMLYRPRTFR
jgi:hypothetical protein